MNDTVYLDSIPKDEDIEDEIKVARNWRQFTNDYLIKDLWPIVFSYLFGFKDHLLVSVPLRGICLEFPDGKALLLPLHCPSYLSCFYGREDEGELTLFNPTHIWFNQTIRVSGHFPLAFCYHTKTLVYITNTDLARRVLVQMTFDPRLFPSPVEEMHFVWHKSCRRVFLDFWRMWSFNEDNNAREREDRVPILSTQNGELWW